MMDSDRFARHDEMTTELASNLARLATILGAERPLAQRGEAVRQHANRVEADRFTIVVVGDFNRGKSTLLNALLGQSILPQKIVPSTAVITTIEFGEQPSASVFFNVAGMERKDMSWEEFKASYILNTEDHAGKDKASTDRFKNVDYANVRFPVQICRHRVTLVDTPGLNDDQIRTERTRRFLENADAVVMVLDATRLFTHQERTFIDFVRDTLHQKTIFFVVNFFNLLQEMCDNPAEIADVEKRLRDTASPYCVVNGVNRFADRVFQVNAKLALKLRSEGNSNREQLEESGVPQFEATLNKFLLDERAAVRNENAVQTALAAQAKFRSFYEEQLRLMKESVQDLEGRQAAIEPDLQRLRRLRGHIEQFLVGHSLTLQEGLLASLRTTLKAVNVDRVVNGFNLSKITDSFIALEKGLDFVREEKDTFEAQVDAQVRPQIEKFVGSILATWRAQTATTTMATEAKALKAYLADEADEYRRIMQQIESTKAGVATPMVDVQTVIAEWLKADWGVANAPLLSGQLLSGAIVDISPLLAGVAADFALHLTAHMFPVIGTVASIALGWWRNSSQIAEIITNIKAGLSKALSRIPDQAQEAIIRSQVRTAYDELSRVVTKNIATHIVETEDNLMTVIEEKKRESFSFEAEKARLDKSEREIDEIVSRMQVKVLAGAPMTNPHLEVEGDSPIH